MTAERPAHVLAVPKWTLAIHAVQLLFAVVVLGLSAYGIRWIAYNVLIYALVVALCTMGVCLYMLASSLFIHKLYNMWAFLGLHIWMIIFWVVQFGLVANLAAIWANPICRYSPYYGYVCYRKRDSTTFDNYRGALIAGAVFGAFEFVSWIASLVILGIHINRHRSNGSPSAPPPTYTGPDQGVPLEQKYNHNGQPPAQPTPQPQYAQPVPHQQQYPQPPQQAYAGHNPGFTTPNHQNVDPVNRQTYTVSPVTVPGQNTSGYTSPQPNHAELATPQHTGEHVYSPNAAELGPGQAHK